MFEVRKTAVFFVLALGAISACSSDKKTERLCPQTAIVRELERINDYGGDAVDEKNLVAAAAMRGVNGKCEYRDDGVAVDFSVDMIAGKKERLGGERVSFPFFVAVVDPNRKILSKELMTAEFYFGGKKTAEQQENLSVFIPTEKDADASYYQVLIGFQLSDEQLAAVRKEKDEVKK